MSLVDVSLTKNQKQLRQGLEEILEKVRIITNENIKHPDIIFDQVSPYIINPSDQTETYAIRKALFFAYPYYTKGKKSIRNNGDATLVHALQTVAFLNYAGADMRTKIIGLHHDIIDINPDSKNEISTKIIIAYDISMLKQILALTPPENLSNPILEKQAVYNQILEISKDDPYKRVPFVRVGDRLSNLYTLDGLKDSRMYTAEERRRYILEDTRRNVLPLAEELDLFEPVLHLHDYMLALIERYEPKAGFMAQLFNTLVGYFRERSAEQQTL